MEVIPLKEKMRACGVCGKLHSVSELTEFDDTLLCGACLQTESIRCQRYGERIWADDDDGDGNAPLCQSCFDRYYTSCEDCGRVLLTDDAYYESDDDYEARCYSCHCRRQENRCIHYYYYKPEPIFCGEGSRYFGVELELMMPVKVTVMLPALWRLQTVEGSVHTASTTVP